MKKCSKCKQSLPLTADTIEGLASELEQARVNLELAKEGNRLLSKIHDDNLAELKQAREDLQMAFKEAADAVDGIAAESDAALAEVEELKEKIIAHESRCAGETV